MTEVDMPHSVAGSFTPPASIVLAETVDVLGLGPGVTTTEEVISMMLNRQHRDRPSASYLTDVQGGAIEAWIRKIVVQFLNELGEDFQMRNDTVGLAVHYFDRFLSAARVERADVQLYAVACVLISAKFGERRMPALADLEYVCRGKYGVEQIKAAETRVLECLRWQLHTVTPHAFCRQLLWHALGECAHAEALYRHAEFFIDLSYYVYEALAFSPCVVGAAALLCSQQQLARAAAMPGGAAALAQHALGEAPPDAALLCAENICGACGFEQSDVAECRRLILGYFEHAFVPYAQREAGQELATPIPSLARDKSLSPDTVDALPAQCEAAGAVGHSDSRFEPIAADGGGGGRGEGVPARGLESGHARGGAEMAHVHAGALLACP